MSRKRPKPNSAEHNRTSSLDDLMEFEQYRNDVLPVLRKAIAEKWTAEQIRKHPLVQAMLESRKITIALTEPDASKALAAIKDVSDRTEGKPTERREVKHSFENMSDEELDALLASKEGALATDDDSLPN